MNNCITISMIFLCLKVGMCQDENSFIKLSNSYNNLYPIEKVHLHTDKSTYITGETIWFKAYVSLGPEQYLSGLSKILHVDLIDINDKLIVQTNVALVNGLGVADIPLQDSLVEGVYRLRAYTRWMRNFEDEYFYKRQVLIGNVSTDAIFTETTIHDNYKIATHLKNIEGFPLRQQAVEAELIRNEKVIEKLKTVSNTYGDVSFDFNMQIQPNDVIKYQIKSTNTRNVSKNIYVNPVRKEYSVNLVPEGGSLVLGFMNNIAIKAVNTHGLGAKAKIVLMNGQDTLLSTVTNELGYGKIQWKPFISEELYCLAEFEDGVIKKVPMLEISNSGHTLKIHQINNAILRASLYRTKDLIDERGVFCILHHQGKIYYHKEFTEIKEEIQLEIDTDNFPSGLLSLSIFDKDLKPVAERAFFNISSNLRSPIHVYTDKSIYKIREKVSVTMELKGDSLQPRIGAFSASVLDITGVEVREHYQSPNIFNSFLVQKNLNGFIEKPNYYFSKDSVKWEELDLLALLHDRRNISWTGLDTNQVMKYEVSEGIEIKGNLINIGRNHPEKDAKVRIFLKNNKQEYRERISNKDGYFNFTNLFYPEGTEYLITAQSSNPKVRIDIQINDEDNVATLNKSKNKALIVNDVNKILYKELKLAKDNFNALEKVGLKERFQQIEEVVVEGVRNKATLRSKNLNGAGNADYVLNAKDLENFNSIEEAVLPLLRIYDTFEWPENIAIFLDGRYLDYDMGRNLPIGAMETVEILRNEIYTSRYTGSIPFDNFTGIIVLTTKIGYDGLNTNKREYGKINYTPKGIHINSSFFKPVYTKDTDRTKFKDLRSTIHWEPRIVVGKSGVAQFDFFTADTPGIYELTVEGLDLNGSLVSEKIHIHVVSN